jgi:hypothetical protein
VYRIYDRLTDELLYVGSTVQPLQRMRDHHDTYRYRFEDVRYEFDARTATLTEARQDERRQILDLNPRDNVARFPVSVGRAGIEPATKAL